MKLPYYHLDAFSPRPFGGNPAAVCPLEEWLPDETMQAIAAELHLSETAFFVPAGDGYDLRWFTPRLEVDLCGHATLASAAVVFERLRPEATHVVFGSKSGPLSVARLDTSLELDFPARPARSVPVTDDLVAALGSRPTLAIEASSLFAIFDDAETVRSLTPDFARLAALPDSAVGVTAPGTGPDSDVAFVSRYFAPAKGVPEDPVTGSAHCTLTPYWTERLGQARLRARQVSRRQGELTVTTRGDRVGIAGQVVFVGEGTLTV